MNDYVLVAIVALLGPLAPMAVISKMLNFFVALKAVPTRRASWVAGISCGIVSPLIILGLPDGYGIWATASCIFGGLVIFLYWRWEYKKAWIDDHLVSGDVALENDDWKIGLITLVGIIVIALIATLYRQYR